MEKQIWQRPLELVFNKVPRYPGGREIDRFRGIDNPKDDGRPEAWVGSVTYAVNRHMEQDENLGLSEVLLPTGQKVLLKDLIERNPVKLLGKDHESKFGCNTCLLVKLLDAKEQLGLQTHPTREYAKKHFNSEFGKAESWYVIGLREDQQEQPYVLLGFKEGITRQVFEELYEKQDIRSMEEWCHKIPVSPGDMFFVDAGIPHAVGPGCFLVEVQESSDITVGVRKRGFASKREELEYKERLLGCYKYNGTGYAENLKRYKVPRRTIRSDKGGTETLLLGKEQTPYFSIVEVEIRDEFSFRDTGTFSIVIVLEGEGRMIFEGGVMDIKKSGEIFLPAGIKNFVWSNKGDEPLRIIQAFPPEAI